MRFPLRARYSPGNTDCNSSMVRAFSRINAAFVSFIGSNAADTPVMNKHSTTKNLNPTESLVGPIGNIASSDESLMGWDLQLGSLKYPETQCSNIPETFSLLRQATSVYDQSIRSLSIASQSYAARGCVIGTPLQAFNGLNSRPLDSITFRTENISANAAVNGAHEIHVSLVSQMLVQVREGNITVLD